MEDSHTKRLLVLADGKELSAVRCVRTTREAIYSVDAALLLSGCMLLFVFGAGSN